MIMINGNDYTNTYDKIMTIKNKQMNNKNNGTTTNLCGNKNNNNRNEQKF